MDINQIAKRNSVSPRFVYFIKKGERYTDNPNLAVDIARGTGEKPLIYMKPSLRKVLKAHLPHLNRKHGR